MVVFSQGCEICRAESLMINFEGTLNMEAGDFLDGCRLGCTFSKKSIGSANLAPDIPAVFTSARRRLTCPKTGQIPRNGQQTGTVFIVF